jgi:hypothetical protein
MKEVSRALLPLTPFGLLFVVAVFKALKQQWYIWVTDFWRPNKFMGDRNQNNKMWGK